MTRDDNPNHRSPSPDRAPSLGGSATHRPTHNEPSLSLDRLLPGLREALESSDRGQRLHSKPDEAHKYLIQSPRKSEAAGSETSQVFQ